MAERHSTLREQRRLATQRTLQTVAVRLFVDRGYDRTAVTDVAAAAGVSPMTVYRHFPTKEDLVLVDQNGPLVAERIAATAAGQPLVHRIGSALIDSARTLTAGDDRLLLARLRLMISTPALRARHLDSQYVLQQAIVEALGADAADPDTAFEAAAAASACLAAMHTALVRWAQDDGRSDLPDLIAKALAAAFGADAPGTG
ncbi:TetR/AcrR family transcriptional regulator [Micromonospora sp. bgisy143]|uniref:TetR/AcrR family transcriptional regulator n=1 Tax=Micromonospora sp. bgisy143 TaxID=3413790 RepID=UPI003EB88458